MPLHGCKDSKKLNVFSMDPNIGNASAPFSRISRRNSVSGELASRADDLRLVVLMNYSEPDAIGTTTAIKRVAYRAVRSNDMLGAASKEDKRLNYRDSLR